MVDMKALMQNDEIKLSETADVATIHIGTIAPIAGTLPLSSPDSKEKPKPQWVNFLSGVELVEHVGQQKGDRKRHHTDGGSKIDSEPLPLDQLAADDVAHHQTGGENAGEHQKQLVTFVEEHAWRPASYTLSIWENGCYG